MVKKSNMKFTVYAALIASACAAKCDPSKISYEIYNDVKCSTLNEEATKQYSTIKKSDYPKWESGCQVFESNSYKLSCDG